MKIDYGTPRCCGEVTQQRLRPSSSQESFALFPLCYKGMLLFVFRGKNVLRMYLRVLKPIFKCETIQFLPTPRHVGANTRFGLMAYSEEFAGQKWVC